MSLLSRFRSNAYRVRAVAYLLLGVFLLVVTVSDTSHGLLVRVLSFAVAFVAIIGGLKRALAR
jgi:hypothetical protein